MKRIRVISCLVILLFAYNLPIRSIDKTKNLEVLADSARHLLGKSGFVPVNTAWMQLARDLNDSIQIYRLYQDNTESSVESLEEISAPYLYGIEK